MNNPAATLIPALARAKHPGDFISAHRHAMHVFEDHTAEVINGFGITLDCRKGCCICCHFPIRALPVEVFTIADFIQTRFSDSEKDDVLSRLHQHISRASELTMDDLFSTNARCPLLVGSDCSVYSERPINCREFHSKSVAQCRHSFEHPEDDEALPLDVYDRQLAGRNRHDGTAIKDAYSSAGLDTSEYELGTALYEALTNPKARRRWTQGKKAFLTSPHQPSEPA